MASLVSAGGIFFEGFESGSLDTNNWTNTGSGADWGIDTAPYTGTYNMRVKNTINESIIEVNVSTEAYENILFSFYADTNKLDLGEYIAADWYNGTAWINAMPQTQNISGYTFYSYNLTSDADDNSNFKIRFRCLSDAANEKCDVDNVNITGMLIQNQNEGELELMWIDPDDEEIHREQKEIMDMAEELDAGPSFIENIFQSLFSILMN
ncbi:hypothetical protein KY312_00715 [Candidatus Woesearchaeota archaeon]|nr:hypothetical protein [Candidatus Woesearchaeota archaeon]